MILTIRTDKPEAEVGLYESDTQVAYKTWPAHRELSATVHTVIFELLSSQQKTFRNIRGIIFYEGPGSFTGLRIGAAVTNALAEGGVIPLAQAGDAKWIEKGLTLLETNPATVVVPVYGAAAVTTLPKK